MFFLPSSEEIKSLETGLKKIKFDFEYYRILQKQFFTNYFLKYWTVKNYFSNESIQLQIRGDICLPYQRVVKLIYVMD